MLHTAAGTLAGVDAWFANPASQVSAQFCTGLAGAVHQYVQIGDSAWGAGVLEPGNTWDGPAGVNPNNLVVSLETEDTINGVVVPVSDLQYEATRALILAVILPACPTIHRLTAHHILAPRSRVNCPGPRWCDTGRFDNLARDCGLIANR